MTDVSISLPAKRRRGRPRKDTNLPQDSSLHHHSPGPPAPAHPTQEPGPNLMVGSSIYGVIEGSFDAGYLISVKIGNGGTPFRGVVFQPKKFVPITSANDVAPQAQMYLRREITRPFPDGPISPGFSPRPHKINPNFLHSKQMVFRPNLPSLPLSAIPCFGNQPGTPTGGPNLQPPHVHPTDETEKNSQVHGEFVDFASNSLTVSMPGPTFDVRPRTEYTDGTYYNGPSGQSVTFHHDLFADPSRPDSSEPACLRPEYNRSEFTEHVPKNTNLKLDLSSSVHEKNDEAHMQTNYLIGNETKSLDLGYHNAIVSGNPLFLPPDFNGEPLDFMVGKNLTQMSGGARQETSNEAASSPSGPYVLELATPQSTINARPGPSVGCITDMDFVIKEAAQHTEQHWEFSEKKQ